ncbi:MAG: hypothetical protein KBB54_03155 [Candidatus Pacebacteria bacterium]|nr:hypothetical protein [Candidatus Paceibacterota bacterium]MBP9819100.1 hypothetical protein [Candidatus Paceibacterota bacterium]
MQLHLVIDSNFILNIVLNPLFLLGMMAWTLIGLRGVYLSTWNTWTPERRWEKVKTMNLPKLKKIGMFQSTVTILLVAVLCGPFLWLAAKFSLMQYKIRQVSGN